MNNTRLLMLGAVVLVVIIAGFLLLSNKTGDQSVNQSANPSPMPTSVVLEQAAVSVTANGFEPKTLTVKEGTNVIWTNNSGDIATVNSANHPTHLRFPFLNLGSFDNGKSVSVVFDKKGAYLYHDHLNPERTGTVIVE